MTSGGTVTAEAKRVPVSEFDLAKAAWFHNISVFDVEAARGELDSLPRWSLLRRRRARMWLEFEGMRCVRAKERLSKLSYRARRPVTHRAESGQMSVAGLEYDGRMLPVYERSGGRVRLVTRRDGFVAVEGASSGV